MTRQEFRDAWEARREEWSRRNATMPAGPLLAEVLADLDAVDRAEGAELLSLTEAAIRCGFNRDSLARMIREGRLANHGRKNAPRVRASDLPRKPLRPAVRPFHLVSASRQKARVSITTPGGQ